MDEQKMQKVVLGEIYLKDGNHQLRQSESFGFQMISQGNSWSNKQSVTRNIALMSRSLWHQGALMPVMFMNPILSDALLSQSAA